MQTVKSCRLLFMMTAMYLNLLDIGTVTKPVMQFYRIYEVLCSVDKWIFI